MKVFISVDIEGVTGVTHWDETELSNGVYAVAGKADDKRGTGACEGAIEAGCGRNRY